ncbi:BMP family ABC transporter substrate-binding protein [Lachnobacterium bovis]|uniref:BMP family ABC transporter substrate-binding protein n=1 Tax=Lachnobacterium bovis TaxID=140626 RepID=UPI00048EA050|nr:BMP family ABC transporter substrate-binding protein [Lachnobacterium bovis]
MKKLISLIALVLVIVCSVALFITIKDKKKSDDSLQTIKKVSLKKGEIRLGVMLPGDETDSFSKNQIASVKDAAKQCNIPENDIIWKTQVKNSSECKEAMSVFAEANCTHVFVTNERVAASVYENAEDYPDIKFFVYGGTAAKISKVKNVYDYSLKDSEYRYISGVISGMKIKELQEKNALVSENYDDDNKIRLGFIGSYNNSKTISAYTAFFLGVKSVVPDVTMDVEYTDGKNNVNNEGTAVQRLMSRGAVVIGYDTNSLSIPSVVQAQKDGGKNVYLVSANANMLDIAPTAQLAAETNKFNNVYKDIITKCKNNEKISQDLAYGYKEDALEITSFGPEAPANVSETVNALQEQFKQNQIKVFDTSKFKVNGSTLTKATIDLSFYEDNEKEAKYKGKEKNAIVKEGDINYFSESSLRSAAYFNYIIDGIKEMKVGELEPKE